jgi:hypothetical protein
MADVNNSMIHGIGPVLEVLRRMEPELYKSVVAEMKTKAEPLRAKVAEGFPDKPWQSSKKPVQWTLYGRTTRGRKPNGTSGPSFPRYNGKKARKGVTVRVGGRKVRRTNSYPILRIVQSDAGGQIYDLAKLNQTSGKKSFVDNLNKTGEPSRVMWKRVRDYLPLVERDIDKIVDDISNRFTVEIATETERRNQRSISASKQVRDVLGRFAGGIR